MTQTQLPALAPIFAEIAPRLGLSRPAGQCFAAIWRAAQAPAADDLVAQLGLSRSNVSTALKELRGWGLVQVARSPGARRDFYVAEADPWALVRQVLAERQRRELAPLADRLAALAAGSEPGSAGLVRDLADVAAALSDWQADLARHDPAALAALIEGGDSPKKKKKKRAKHDHRPD